jgi:hypothetical protein
MTIPGDLEGQLVAVAPGRGVLAALRRLFDRDAFLLQIDANERTISHRLGMYLQDEFVHFDVDCEYNRICVDPKRIGPLGAWPDLDDTEGKTVFPDIVVHIRGESKNFLVIEFKKSSNTVSRDFDFKKLRAYKLDPRLHYEHALFLELTVGKQPEVARAEWVLA